MTSEIRATASHIEAACASFVLLSQPEGSDAERAIQYLTLDPKSLLAETSSEHDNKDGSLAAIRFYFLLGKDVETSPRMKAKFKPDPDPEHAQRLFLSSLKIITYDVNRPLSDEARALVTSRSDHKEQAGILRKPASTFKSKFPFEKIWFNPDGSVFAEHQIAFDKMFPPLRSAPSATSAPAQLTL